MIVAAIASTGTASSGLPAIIDVTAAMSVRGALTTAFAQEADMLALGVDVRE